MTQESLWQRFQRLYCCSQENGFAIDVSRMKFDDAFLGKMEGSLNKAFLASRELEGGALSNPDENRMVGHYWLRDSSLAPSAEIKSEIDKTLKDIKEFSAAIHAAKIVSSKNLAFKHLLVVGIGGSALGPQFVNQALGSDSDPMDVYFFDNTDPDGMNKVLSSIPDLGSTLCVVISKSGGTKETRNGQLVAKEAFKRAGLDFAKHFVAVTGAASELDKTATAEKWLARFPMWDWVGGRTSELSAVGLLPAALQGFDIQAMLDGAKNMDALTRSTKISENPAALLALSWYHAGGGKGAKDMVVLPYKDRLELFSRYLQQLLMESLGKEHDLDGKVVNQGIAVYGNKGSTDQHAYVQQLRDGVNNFFAVFIEVLRDRSTKYSSSAYDSSSLEVEQGITSGDYLNGFYLGTRKALYEKNRESVTITIDQVDDRSVGMLIALFERAVSLYANLVNINAYHQPGVEAGKKAASEVLEIQKKIVAHLRAHRSAQNVDEIAAAIGQQDDRETVFKVLRHLAANARVEISAAQAIFEDKYSSI